jgi:SAM-dependent methyltransferase
MIREEAATTATADGAAAATTTAAARGAAAGRTTTRLEPAELLYGRLLASAAAGAEPREARVRIAGGRAQKLPLERWLAPVDAADRAVLAHATGPILDIGCGPGRHLAALAALGYDGLGLDLSPVAVRIARARGAEAILRSVFSDVPRAGRWRTALLLDGNVGIGGAPELLLRRTRELLAPRGEALVELDPPGRPTFTTRIRLETHGAVSDWFAWARVSVDGIAPLAARGGLGYVCLLAVEGRWIAVLRRP